MDTPTLVGLLSISGKQVAVWCPHCNRNHFHGWPEGEEFGVATHRVAHCTKSNSPFEKGGYFITVEGRKDAAATQ